MNAFLVKVILVLSAVQEEYWLYISSTDELRIYIMAMP